MAVLLIALSVMGIMLSVAMPAWKQMAQREKEAELVFRGQQYARAIGLFQKRAGPGVLPPNVDVLVQQRFLRKKYKDPITGDDFQLLLAGQQLPGQAGGQPTGPQGRGAQPGRGTPGQAPTVGAPSGAVGGIQGVVSKSKAKSLRVFNGRTVYNEWAFVFVPQVQAGGAGGAGGPGGAGSPGPGGVGNPGPGGVFGPGGRGRSGAGGGFGSPNGPGGRAGPPSGPAGPGRGGSPSGSPNFPGGGPSGPPPRR